MQKKRRTYSIQQSVKLLIIVLVPILILNLIVSIFVIIIVREQTTQYLASTAELYIAQINGKFSSIKHFMGWAAVNDESLNKIQQEDFYKEDFNSNREKIYSRFSEFQLTCGREYNFFAYLKDKEAIFNCAPMTIDYKEFTSLKNTIPFIIEEDTLYQSYSREWTTLNIGKNNYVINIVPYDTLFLVCLIKSDDFLKPLRQLDMGNNGTVTILENKPHELGREDINQEKSNFFAKVTQFARSETVLNENFENATFHIQMLFDNFGVFERVIFVQLLMVALVSLIAIVICIITFYMKKKILRPIQYFVDNLSNFDENSETLKFKSSNIMELEHVNEQFKTLIHQIKRLKIDIYEKELQQKQIQLDYMHLQIKPHFFLNCLTNIYSMAQVQMYEEIEKMCLSTSNYFRYIFQNNSGFVTLTSEIDHVRDYLDIQQTSFGEAFSYYVETDPQVGEAKIPPLVLQTFIENAVKHGVNLDGSAHISLIAQAISREGKPFVEIKITDTGDGFPPEVLTKLESGQALERVNGKHIGINNTVERLKLLYKEEFALSFSNLSDGGAEIYLLIPNAR